MNAFDRYCEELSEKIRSTYESGISISEAEKLASELIMAQIATARELQTVDLDSRMKKSGVKAVRGAVYLDLTSKADKKPTEAALAASIDTNKIVLDQQQAYDEAEVRRAYLENFFSIFRDAHIHFRHIAKGTYE